MNLTVDATQVVEDEPVRKSDAEALQEVSVTTRMMRDHQEQITSLGRQRRKVILRLRDHKITYREIAEAMGTTEQAVYKVIRGDL